MSGRTNELDSSSVCLMVWLGTLERRKEGVMNVDNLPRHLVAQGWTQDLHVASEYDEIDFVLVDQFENLCFLPFLCLAACDVDG